MKTTINKTFEIERSINEVWDFLSDPRKIVTCVPGAQISEQIDDTNYKGTVNMKIGPVSTSFKGQITLVSLDKVSHTIEITGKGTDSKGKGSANMVLRGKLVDKGDQTTEVTNNMDISISGKLAQFGSRMIVDVSDQIFKQFLNNFKGQLETAQADGSKTKKESAEQSEIQEAAPINAVSLFFSSIWAAILRLFGKSS